MLQLSLNSYKMGASLQFSRQMNTSANAASLYRFVSNVFLLSWEMHCHRPFCLMRILFNCQGRKLEALHITVKVSIHL